MKFLNNNNSGIVLNIVQAIQDNKVYLSDIDGRIGDGDHGINMNKGFSMAGKQIVDTHSFSSAMQLVGDTLLFEIGGSMGPIYGTFFQSCADVTRDKEVIDAPTFHNMLEIALKAVKEIGGAKVGDKTLIDTMEPAVTAFQQTYCAGSDFRQALADASAAAGAGMESTRDMVARIGRAARLGERSVGVLDAGAVSCYIILQALFESVSSVLTE